MCGGGGGAPAPVDPRLEANAQIRIERERAELAERQRIAEQQRQAEQEAKDSAAFMQNLDAAVQSALLRGRGLIEQRGLPFDVYEPALQSELQAVRQSVPYLDPSPGTYFAPDLADIVLNRSRDQSRRGFETQLNQFAGPGFAEQLFPNTADDAILQAILQEQYDPALSQLQRAHQRGNLTDIGFETASNQLGGQREAALSRLQDLGGGVLSGYRNQLGDIAAEGFNRAGTFELGGTFDPLSYQGRINTTAADLTSRLPGDIRGALGSDQLFNIEDLITRGGIAQGAQNSASFGSPSIIDALALRERERAKPRGLGGQGAF